MEGSRKNLRGLEISIDEEVLIKNLRGLGLPVCCDVYIKTSEV
jgi:hypothetical protein